MTYIPAAAFQKLQAIVARSTSSPSHLHEYGSNGYKDGIRHYLLSSTEFSELVFVPGTVEDLSEVIAICGEFKIPFAVKCGGHATSPELSSTKGLLIYMVRFDRVGYNVNTQLLEVGGGCLWEQAHSEAMKNRRVIVGGSASEGVGVGGWLMGGGYSLQSNRRGLGIDNIEKFQVVLPNGGIVEVDKNDTARSDLFEALKGGGNNFGIVTKFTLKTYDAEFDPWDEMNGVKSVYSGRMKFNWSKRPQVKNAIVDFVQNGTRLDASIVAVFSYSLANGKDKLQSSLSVFALSYTRSPNPDPFQNFRNISPTGSYKQSANPSPLSEDETDDEGPFGFEDKPYFEMDRTAFLFRYHGHSIPSTPGTPSRPKRSTSANPPMSGVGEISSRGRWACVMIKRYTKRIIDEIEDTVRISSLALKPHRGIYVSMDIWPFRPEIFQNSTPGAWPHPPGQSYGPCIAIYRWAKAADDDYWLGEMQRALNDLMKVAKQEGCADESVPKYLNTSLHTTPIGEIYQGNLQRLREIRWKYDPDDIMSNAGNAFRIPLPSPRPPRPLPPQIPNAPVVKHFTCSLTGDTYGDVDSLAYDLYTSSLPVDSYAGSAPLPGMSVAKLVLGSEVDEILLRAQGSERSYGQYMVEVRAWRSPIRCRQIDLSWLEIPYDYPSLQHGMFEQGITPVSASGNDLWTARVNFDRPFSSTPNVVVFFTQFYVDASSNWKAGAGAQNIDQWGFTITVSAAAYDPQINTNYTLTWIAHESNATHIASGEVGEAWVNSSASTGHAYFGKRFKRPPIVLAGLNSIEFHDADSISIEFSTQNVTETGLDWMMSYQYSPWGGGFGSYIAFEP